MAHHSFPRAQMLLYMALAPEAKLSAPLALLDRPNPQP